MKFNFKIQQFQTDAVNAVADVFSGQHKYERTSYIRDLGKGDFRKKLDGQVYAAVQDDTDERITTVEDDVTGYKNEDIELTDEQLLSNIRNLQAVNNIKQSPELIKDLGRCSLDIEMETGTGKTYVYIKTMFELNKRYGWSKYIVIVPSIAIREGVKKSFEITAEHFMEQYGKKARFFIYNSSNLTQLDNFSSSAGINVMIINTQAFAASLKEGANNKESRIIYSKRDEFGSRRPIDVIAANRPIVIRDEPQKMGGDVTQATLKNFKPLFSLNYSATHAKQHNLVYVLDALDAYSKRLVKSIEVKGFAVKNLRGTEGYLYLEEIVLSKKDPPMARIEMEVRQANETKRHIFKLGEKDNLFYISNEMEQYREYVIHDIDPVNSKVTFKNGEVLYVGDVVNDSTDTYMRRIQIRETIQSHFEKEAALFNKGIKTLSLFFIDEVSKYRQYDENGNEVLGEYGRIFEEEYSAALKERMNMFDGLYKQYLERTCADIHRVHNGYFSIDKKTGHSVNYAKDGKESKLGDGKMSDDNSAYDLILKNKERLLSFDEPTRFIFSHSALREGWDNPNIFQICTLKHSNSETAKRQEVGRGLRLCVNQNGDRMDAETCGDMVHDINVLTVVASESYKDFVAGLQDDTKKTLYERPTKVTAEYFEGKTVLVGSERVTITKQQAKEIYHYLIKNDYIDTDDKLTDEYHAALDSKTLVPLPESVENLTEGVKRLIQGVFDEKVFKEMVKNAGDTKVKENKLNDNFKKTEFRNLWNYINHKYAYSVNFDSNELIKRSIESINVNLTVSHLQYTTSVGRQKADISAEEISSGNSFTVTKTSTQTMKLAEVSQVPYDLVGQIAKGTILTRRTSAAILSGIREDKFYMFKANPEEFISKAVKLINEQKAELVIDNITYHEIDGKYDDRIFEEKPTQPYEKAFKANKAIQDYVFTDGYAADGNSVERKFVSALDTSDEVAVYAKLPKSFHIPTPVGNYSPDWAIAFKDGTVKYIYFIAETKGSADLRKIEEAKTECAKKLFNKISTSNLKYDVVTSYQELMNKVQ